VGVAGHRAHGIKSSNMQWRSIILIMRIHYRRLVRGYKRVPQPRVRRLLLRFLFCGISNNRTADII
jgi:hypothetical protein